MINSYKKALNAITASEDSKQRTINEFIRLNNAKKESKNMDTKQRKAVGGKKILAMALSGVFAIAITFGILVITGVLFQPPYTEGLQYNLINNSYYEVSLGSATDKDIRIAPEYNNLPVKQIAKAGFMKTDIRSIEMPDSITFIDGSGELECGAFWGCENLVKVILSENITSIGAHAFAECINLTNITIPNSVTSIGYGAFKGCESLTSITIPDSVTSIGEWVFASCTSLASITVSNGNSVYKSDGNCLLTIDGKTLVLGCKNSIIPNSVRYIGDWAFNRCTNLTNITIPDSVTSIGNAAFHGCTSLTSIIIPDSVTIINFFAFLGCTSLKSITIGSGVTRINDAFGGCPSLASITVSSGNSVYKSDGNCLLGNDGRNLELGCKNSIIPNSVMYIVGGAFKGCTNLTSITIPDSVIDIGYGAFKDCISLTSITIPNRVMGISSYAFSGCTSLKSITIPDSVTNIGECAFAYCSSLASITVSSGNRNYKSEGNCLLTKDGETLILGCKNSIIPNSVTSIDLRAFSGCKSLTSITIPDSVISIGDWAFSSCESLKSITIGNNVTSIGDRAFSGCTSLTSVIIPKSVTSIGELAFSGCTSLTIYCEAESKPEGWDLDWNFSGCAVVWRYKL